MSISGCATPEGTSRYRDRFANAANHHFRQTRNLLLSSIGIGTYLGNPDDATDQSYFESLVRAVLMGSNVIDSAANYRFQRSERTIGKALATLVNKHGYLREELVICTKGGYLPFDGAPPHNLREYVDETFVKTGIASFDDIVGGSHCMTPSYLQSQLDQSLTNMGLECIDVYYIHNPESQLRYVSGSEFYYCIEQAFKRLEENRQNGKLKYYGVATWNGFRVSGESTDHLSLQRMVEAARKCGGDEHGFRFVQLPFNLAMPEALTLITQGVDNAELTLLEAAESLGITVVASASMLQGRAAKGLPEAVRRALGSLATDAQSAIQFVRSTPGITTALIGMSNVKHVEENLLLANIEPIGPQDFAELFS